MQTRELKTKSERAYVEIRRLIRQPGFKPKELTEKRLVELTGFKRGPVRNSLVRLQAEGILRIQGSRRGRVIEYIEDQVPDAALFRYELREYIEGAACCLAANNFNGWQIARLKELLKEIEELESQGLQGDYWHGDAVLDFHDYIIENCGNPLISKAWRLFHLQPLRPGTEESKQKIENGREGEDFNEPSLRQIFDAIATHNAELAEKLAKQRVREITNVLRRKLYT